MVVGTKVYTLVKTHWTICFSKKKKKEKKKEEEEEEKRKNKNAKYQPYLICLSWDQY